MTESRYDFQCRQYVQNADGKTSHYILQVTDITDGETEVLSVAPEVLSSPTALKIALLDRKIIYTTTLKKHNDMLRELFALSLEAIDSAPYA
ncbi:hypothetical protein ACYZUA_19495 [Pseudomonas sp. LS2P72]